MQKEDSESTAIGTYFQRLEDTVISTLNIIFTKIKVSQILAKLMIAFSFFQLFTFLIDTKRDYFVTAKDEIQLQNLQDFLFTLEQGSEYLILYRFYFEQGMVLSIFFYTVFIFVLAFAGVILYLFHAEFRQKQENSLLGSKVLIYMVLIYEFVFLIPIHILFVSGISYPNKASIIDQIPLDSVEGYIRIIIGSVGLVLNLLIGVLFCYYGQNPTEVESALSRITNQNEKAFFFYRILMASMRFSGIFDDRLYTNLRVWINFLVLGWFAYSNYKWPLFYNRRVSQYVLSRNVLAFMISTAIMINSLVETSGDEIQQVLFIVTFFAAPLCVKLSFTSLSMRYDAFYSQAAINAEYSNEILIKFAEYYNLLKDSELIERNEYSPIDIVDLRIKGLITRHQTNCRDPTCVCARRDKLYYSKSDVFSNLNIETYEDLCFKVHFGLNILSTGRKKFHTSVDLSLIFAYFQVKEIRFVHQSFIILQSVRSKVKTITQKILYQIVQNEIKQALTKKYYELGYNESIENFIDSKKVLDLDDKLKDFMAQVTKSVLKSFQFWGLLKQPSLILVDIQKAIDELHVMHEQIVKQWELVSKFRHRRLSFYSVIYGIYLFLVRNNVGEGAKKMKDSYKHHEREREKFDAEISKANLYTEEVVCLQISGEKKALSQILKITDNVKPIFGYEPQKLIGAKVDDMMPIIFSKDHDFYIQGYLETGREVILNKMRVVYGLHEKGHCFPVHIFVKMNPDISQGITYIGLLKAAKTYEYTILTDTSGVIDCVSSNIVEETGLTPALFNTQKLLITHFIPELREVLFALNQQLYDEYGESFIKNTKDDKNNFKKHNFIKGEYLSYLDEICNIDTYKNGADPSKAEKYKQYQEAFSSAKGVKVIFRVPSALIKLSDEGTDPEIHRAITRAASIRIKTGNDLLNDLLSDELEFICNIKDNMFKGKHLIRAIVLKLHEKEKNIAESEESYTSGASPTMLFDYSNFEQKSMMRTRTAPVKMINKTGGYFEVESPAAKYKAGEKKDSPVKRARKINPTMIQVTPKINVLEQSYAKSNKSKNHSSFLIPTLNDVSKADMSMSYNMTTYNDIDDKGMSEIHNETLKENFHQYQKELPEEVLQPDSLVLEIEQEKRKTGLDTTQDNINNSFIPLVSRSFVDDTNVNADRLEAHRNLNKKRNSYLNFKNKIKTKMLNAIKLLKFKHDSDGTLQEQTNNMNDVKRKMTFLDPAKAIEDDRTSTSSTSGYSSFCRNYVRAIEEPFYSNSFRMLVHTMHAVLLTIFVLSIIVLLIELNSMNQIKKDLLISRTGYDRNYYTLGVFRRARAIDFLKENTTSLDRFAQFGIPDYFNYTISRMQENLGLMQENTIQFYEQLANFPEDFQLKAYSYTVDHSKIDEVTGEKQIIRLNIFQFCYQMLSDVLPAIKNNLQEITENVNESYTLLESVIRNVPNELILAFEDMQKILVAYIFDEKSSIQFTTYLSGGAIIASMFISFVLFVPLFGALNRSKEKVLSLFNQLEERDIESQYHMFERTYDLFLNTECSTERTLIEFQMNREKYSLQKINLNNSKRTQRKLIKTAGIHKKTFVHLTKLFVLYVCGVAYFAVVMITFVGYLERATSFIDQIITTQQLMMNQSYTWDSYADLVGENGTTNYLGSPSYVTLNEKLTAIEKISEISKIYYNKDQTIDPAINNYLNGNLCTIQEDPYCLTIAETTLTKGLLQYSIYFSSTISASFDDYELLKNSDYNKMALYGKKEIIEAEYSSVNIVRLVYQKMLDYLFAKFVSNNDTQSKTNIDITIAFIAVEIALIILIWLPLYEELKNQQLKLKYIFRMIPVEIILKNSFIRLVFKKMSPKTLTAFKI